MNFIQSKLLSIKLGFELVLLLILLSKLILFSILESLNKFKTLLFILNSFESYFATCINILNNSSEPCSCPKAVAI